MILLQIIKMYFLKENVSEINIKCPEYAKNVK